jgi:hypothetical protein
MVAFRETLGSAAFHKQLEELGGYTGDRCGELKKCGIVGAGDIDGAAHAEG